MTQGTDMSVISAYIFNPVNVGDLSAFSECVPLGCAYFNSPKMSECGGGVASVFKEAFTC